MKKSILQFSVIAAIAATMTLSTSCSSDDDVYVPEPVVFNAGMSGLDINRATTRAVSWTTVADGWASGIKVKLYTTEANGTTYANKTYVSNSINNSTIISGTSMYYTELKAYGTNPDDCFYWASTSDTKNIRAWTYGTSDVPSTDIATSGGTLNTLEFELSGTGGSAQTNKELLYCYQQYSYGDKDEATKSLVFRHQLSKVTVKVYAQQSKVTSCTFGSNTTPATTTIPVKNTFTQPVDDTGSNNTLGTNGTWTAFGDYDAAKYGYITPQTEVTAGTNSSDLSTSDLNSTYTVLYQYQGVLLPGDYNGKNLIEIVYDGAKYSYIPESSHVLAIGKHYTYKVIVKDAALEVTAAIQPWTGESKGEVDANLQ